MSMEFVKRNTIRRPRSSWSSVAFIVESILLLVFLVASLAVLTKVFTASLTRSVESRTLDAATIAATSIAEHFTAEPTDVPEKTQLGDLLIVCDVSDEPREAGVMHYAVINVYDTGSNGEGEPVYSLSTSCYEGEGQ